MRDKAALREPVATVETLPMVAAIVSTLLSFALVLLLFLMWVGLVGMDSLWILIPFFEAPPILWIPGMILLVFGILIHAWSRWVRKHMASSWEMTEEHALITSGPYRFVRHPSYTSYALCFVGLFLMLPSLVTTILLSGVPAYNMIAKREEVMLLEHFGDEYREYMNRTGRMVPGA
ncbi:isoprenylcysteine carboxylmethyltransferase family protein [Candidatus Thorarchaeota archaeon]|nr:MAG: isoprenylcysteine carboxylmethyltransferase family protein [Candidatus Thorarchaeota archaeon]